MRENEGMEQIRRIQLRRPIRWQSLVFPGVFIPLLIYAVCTGEVSPPSDSVPLVISKHDQPYTFWIVVATLSVIVVRALARALIDIRSDR